MKRIGARADTDKVKQLGCAIFELAEKLGCNAADLGETCESICVFLQEQGMVVRLPEEQEVLYN